MAPLKSIGLALLLVSGSGFGDSARASEISFRGAVVVPTNSVPSAVGRMRDQAPAVREEAWHRVAQPQDPELLAYALRRAPNVPVYLVTVTYL